MVEARSSFIYPARSLTGRELKPAPTRSGPPPARAPDDPNLKVTRRSRGNDAAIPTPTLAAIYCLQVKEDCIHILDSHELARRSGKCQF